MRTRFLFAALAGMLAIAPASSAQQVISFDDAVSIALDQNVTLRRAKNSVESQTTSLAQAKAARLPNLNLSSNAGRNWGLQFDLTTGRLENQSSDRFSLNASSGVTLFNGFQIGASIDQARASLAAQEAALERSEQTVVFTVITNYLQVILDQEQIRIREEDLEAQQRQLERITEFVRVGQRPISDQYSQEATVANAEATLLTAQRALQLSEARLISTLQLDPLQNYSFTAPSAEAISLAARTYDPNDLLVAAYEARADLQAQKYVISAAEEGMTIAKSSSLPRVSESAGFGTSYSSFGRDPLTGQKSSFGSQMTDNRSESIGISLSVPVFNRFQTRSSVERAQVQLNNASLDLESLEQSIALDVRQSYLDYQTAVKRLEVTEKQLRASQQALEVEQARYDVASSTLVELTQARANYVNSESQRVQAIYQFHLQHRLIEYYLGILNPAESLF
ncbi:MAG: TolC family protein [Rhodothermales bacterium]|nr:TolC family protein [Rhodothermales bacterium]